MAKKATRQSAAEGPSIEALTPLPVVLETVPEPSTNLVSHDNKPVEGAGSDAPDLPPQATTEHPTLSDDAVSAEDDASGSNTNAASLPQTITASSELPPVLQTPFDLLAIAEAPSVSVKPEQPAIEVSAYAKSIRLGNANPKFVPAFQGKK